ncbi:hypothetical protein, partial [Acinetobacter baumannii]|uniref:hypothetical protein n=1 Tax=Acinetobacter baumannii TaxID=470 RepID=UPI001AECC945
KLLYIQIINYKGVFKMNNENFSYSNEQNKVNNIHVSTDKPKKRKKKTVSDIDLQILELQKKRKDMIDKSTSEIGSIILDIFKKHDISFEDIDENLEEFKEELEISINTNIQNFKEIY